MSKSFSTGVYTASRGHSMFGLPPAATSITGTGTTSALISLGSQNLNIIEKLYGANMAARKYENIPSDYQKYLQLYTFLQTLISKTRDKNLAILYKIAQDTLTGAVNSFSMYGLNLSLQIDKQNLQKKINDILINKNEKVVDLANASGQLTINKTFTLAAIFNYYILLYGMPEYGVGFDPIKMSFLTKVLTDMGINPYK